MKKKTSQYRSYLIPVPVSLLVFFFLMVLSLSFPLHGATPTKQSAPPVPAAAKPQYGGILRIAHALDADTLGDPVARPMSSTGVRIAYAAVETLVRYDKKGLPVPWLATGWKISKDLKSITFTLRKSVKFGNFWQ